MQLRAFKRGVAGSDLHFAKDSLAAPGSGDLKGGLADLGSGSEF